MFETPGPAELLTGSILAAIVYPVAPLALCAIAGRLVGKQTDIARLARIGMKAGLGFGLYLTAMIGVWIVYAESSSFGAGPVLLSLIPLYALAGSLTYLAVRHFCRQGEHHSE